MNTDALAVPASAPIDSRRDRSHRFFVGFGFFCMLLVAAGSGPSFYLYFTGEYYFPPGVHVHGAIMFSWLVLFTSQASLAGAGTCGCIVGSAGSQSASRLLSCSR